MSIARIDAPLVRLLQLGLLFAAANGCAGGTAPAAADASSPRVASTLLEGRHAAETLSSIDLFGRVGQAAEQSEDVALRIQVSQVLDHVIRVMAPLCDAGCISVSAAPAPDLETHAALRVGQASGSVLLYRPESMRRMTEPQMFWSIAHEYGHHLGRGAAAGRRAGWHEELHADVLAGCALARANLPLAPLRRVFAADADASAVERLRDDACGSDAEHPALAWHGKAIEAGAALCAKRVPARAAVDAAAARVHQLAVA